MALVYPDHLVGRAYAANSVVWGVMGVAGPGIAAAMLTFASWRWIFFINLPLGLLAIGAGWRVLRATAVGVVGCAHVDVQARKLGQCVGTDLTSRP